MTGPYKVPPGCRRLSRSSKDILAHFIGHTRGGTTDHNVVTNQNRVAL